jgi:alpha-amylase/alpha-mannosidase (GH57 family)
MRPYNCVSMEAQLKTLQLSRNLSTNLDRYATDFIRSPKVSDLSMSDVSQGVYVTLHGHFYQPPRENPYIGAIERQDSAAPFHNWNERICHECYRPNAFARILNDVGEVVEIVNNFEYLSFNIGPTLMSWLEQYDTEVYQRILEADRNSCLRLNGHGNAIAQVYNHIILPLANRQDKITQIRWGKADFQARFNRETEGMWLAEAAVDYATIDVLIQEGIKFIVLAPSQVQRCRPTAPEVDPTGADYPWQDVGGGQIDPTRPYRCFLAGGDRSRDYIDIFVYDGPISRGMGFEDVLNSSEQFANRVAQAIRPDREKAQLISIATDGETFGHHKRSTEKSLAYAFRNVLPQRGWTITNFAHFLSLHPPTWEVEIKPVTAWSCAHGVARWQADCGCGGEGGVWHQKWREPLRDSLDWLRDQLTQVYTELGEMLFQDPWAARNDYIAVLQAQAQPLTSEVRDRFLAHHQHHPLSTAEQVDAFRLLELQRYALLMYTSCGWFFEELSRPEGVQILRYAAKAIALAGEVSGTNLEPEFIEHLALAPSNVEQFGTGAGVYNQLVLPSQVTLHQIVANYAMTSLFRVYPEESRTYCYQTHQFDCETHRMGNLNLAIGHLQLTADSTEETTQVIFAVLHMGGWDFHCVIQPFTGRPYYTALKQALFDQLQQASVSRLVLAMNQYFGDRYYGIQNLFAEDRQHLLDLLSQNTLMRLAQMYTQVYRDNYGLLTAFCQDGREAPQELRVAAQVALSHRATQAIPALLSSLDIPTTESSHRAQLTELAAIATEAQHLGCHLSLDVMEKPMNKLLYSWLWRSLYQDDLVLLRDFRELLKLTHRLDLRVQEDRLQELYVQFLQKRWVPHVLQLEVATVSIPTYGSPMLHLSLGHDAASPEEHLPNIRPFVKLGQLLAIDMKPWLALLQYAIAQNPGAAKFALGG